MNDSDDIAITGVGLVTCLGLTADETWKQVQLGRCGMRAMTAMESPLPPECDGGQAPDLPADFQPTMPREARYLRWTVEAALRDAGFDPSSMDSYDPARCALMLGTTLH